MRKFLVGSALAVLAVLLLAVPWEESLDTTNCEALAKLLTSDYPYEEIAGQFVSDYEGQTIEFDGYVADIEEEWSDEYTITIYPNNFDDEPRLGAHFQFQNVSVSDLGFEDSEIPSFIDYGNDIHVIGTVEAYDDWEECIVLSPIKIESRNALTAGLETSNYVTIEKGDKGDGVKALQQRLIDLYYLNDKADGSYGNNTKAAVEKFQQAIKVEVTGIADPTTQAVLFSEDAPEATLSISSSSMVIGSNATTSWYVDGQEFTLKNSQTKTIKTVWGTYKFDAYGEYEKIEE